jgi:hypothetical protein
MRLVVERYREHPILDAESRRPIESESALVPPFVTRHATGHIVHALLHHASPLFAPASGKKKTNKMTDCIPFVVITVSSQMLVAKTNSVRG